MAQEMRYGCAGRNKAMRMQFLNETTALLQDEYAAQGVECNKDTVCQQTVGQLNDPRVGVRWSEDPIITQRLD